MPPTKFWWTKWERGQGNRDSMAPDYRLFDRHGAARQVPLTTFPGVPVP
jgi:hypothetical protein